MDGSVVCHAIFVVRAYAENYVRSVSVCSVLCRVVREFLIRWVVTWLMVTAASCVGDVVGISILWAFVIFPSCSIDGFRKFFVRD